MKVTSPRSEEFTPLVLTITLESEEEAEAIYSLFCYVPVCEILERHGIRPDDIRAVLRTNGIMAGVDDYAARFKWRPKRCTYFTHT